MFNPIGSTNTPTDPNPLQSDINNTATTQTNPARVHQPMSPSQMEREMEEMIKKGTMGYNLERCRDAKDKIIRAYQTNASHLDLSQFTLRKLPACIGQLQHLTSLKIGRNELAALPPEIGTLNNLTELNADWNQLTTLPPEIGTLNNLTKLSLYSNQLITLPPEIVKLHNLTWLRLSSNQLTTLPPEIVKLHNLTTLSLYGNQITTLPPEIGTLNNLTTLSLDNNQITTLPPEIGTLNNLTRLSLYSNQLTSLPSEIGTLNHLTTLSLDNNQLTTLPPEIGTLNNLTELYLGKNPITTLPIELQEFWETRKWGNNQETLKTHYGPVTYTDPTLNRIEEQLTECVQHASAGENRPAAHQVAQAMQAELSLEQIIRVAAHYLHGLATNSVRLTPNNTWEVQLKGHNPMRKMHLLGLKWVSLEHQLTTLHGDRGNAPYQPMNELTELIHQLPSTHTLRAKLINNPSNQQRLAEAMDEVLNS